MTTFADHLAPRVAALFDPDHSRTARTVHAVAKETGHTSAYLRARLAGEAEFRLRDLDGFLAYLDIAPSMLLTGEPGESYPSLLATVGRRLLAAIQLAGFTATEVGRDVLGDGTPLRASEIERGTSALRPSHVDAVLGHLGLPWDTVLRPVLGPYDLGLLRQVGLRGTPELDAQLATLGKVERAAALVVTEADAVAWLARARGEYVPSRPKGSNANGAGGMLNRAGCAAAVRRLASQQLLDLAPPITLTPAGRALVAAGS